jgi:PKD repeat protein
LYKSERYASAIAYQIPVPNGVYTVTTYHTETWFGLPNGGIAEAGKRVYDILLEDNVVKADFDLFIENNNQPMPLVFENIQVTDGILNLNLNAKANRASISGISVVNQGEIGAIPIANIASSPAGGIAPIEVSFTNEISKPQDFSFAWDFGDGNSSAEQNPVHIFEEPGEYMVQLTVTSALGNSATDSTLLSIIPPSDFELNVNAGSQITVDNDGKSFIGEDNSGVTYTSSNTYTNNSAQNPPLFLTERFGKNITYSAPVQNGVFTVKTYHNELWFGKNGPAGQANQRVYDIYIEGELVKDNFDLFVENANQPLELSHENVVVADDTLNIQLVAVVNNASISGFSLIARDGLTVFPTALAEADTTSGPAPLTITFDGTNSTGEGELTYEWNFGNDSISKESQPAFTFNENGNYLVNLTVSDENGNTDTDELEIVVGDVIPMPSYSLSVNAGTNELINYEDKDFLGEDNAGVLYTNSKISRNNVIGTNPLFHTERYGQSFTYGTPVENGVYTVKTYHNELWFGKLGPASEVGQRVYNILIEGEVVKNQFDLFAEFGNEPTELTFENIEVRDGELTISLQALNNNATISGFNIESVTSVGLPPSAAVNASATEGSAPFEITFDGSASSGSGDLIYNWNFGDGESSDLLNPSHLYDAAGTYTVVLTVMDTAGVMDADSLEINIWEEAPVWSLVLNAGSDINTSYQGRLFLGDLAFPELYTNSRTYRIVPASPFELFQTDRFGNSFAYNVPVDNGTYRVRTLHNELWFGRSGPSAQAGQRVFDIHIEGVLVKDDFDLFVENNYQPTELIFENIVVTDGEINIDFNASADNANVSGIVIERVEPKDGGDGINQRLINQKEASTDVVDEKTEEGLKKSTLSNAKLYPNPAQNEVFITFEGEVSLQWINVYDLNGRQVLTFNASNNLNNQYTLPLERLEQGVYMVRLLGKEGIIDQLRLIIKR